MNGYTLLTEFYSDDKKKTASVYKDNNSASMYKITFCNSDFPQGNLFKFFTDQQKAEDAAEEWIFKND